MREREQIGVAEVRQNLSKYLGRIARGESFEITDRGRPVALLTALGFEGLWQLRAAGLTRRPLEPWGGPPPPAIEVENGPTTAELLDAQRDDRL